MKLVCLSVLISSITNAFITGHQGHQGEAREPLPYNPLLALDWANLDLEAQIADDFVGDCAYSDTAEGQTNPAIIINDIEFRRYDGIGNNIESPHWATTNSTVPRCISAAYGDGYNSLNGETRMNPREISNVISKQLPEEDDKFVNNRHLTQFAWQWGQFIDHDITLISEDKSALDLDDDIDIYIPCGDPVFDNTDTCDADKEMDVFRTKSFGTGTGPTDIRQQFNEITGFMDASMIYGSDQERALELRLMEDGMMKEDDEGLLPKNENGMVNEPNTESKFFLGGDVRVNEQLGLLTMHTIWVRAHNIIAEQVGIAIDSKQKNKGPPSTERDETIYQFTRVIITAIVQKIVYRDWLPTLFGPTAIGLFLGDYSGYNNTINPGICPIFASAAYRLGHTFLPENLPLRTVDCSDWIEFDINNCAECGDGGIPLRASFFDPSIVENNDNFFEALLNGYSCTLANEVDTAITGGVRNFLFESARNAAGNAIFGDLDLMAINIQRGREHGLPDYNTVRRELGLRELTGFDEMTSKQELLENFEIIYGDINDVDLFLGGLAEDHFNDGSFGETISKIVLEQFGRLRDGDRFFYQNYIKPGELMDFINCITLKNIIELTTDIDNIDAIDSIQHNIFQNMRAISIFAERDTFNAQVVEEMNIDDNNNYNQPPPQQQWYGNDYNQQKQPQQTGIFIIQLSNFQIVLFFVSIIVIIGCCCYINNQFHKNRKNKRYDPVKYDTEYTDSDVSHNK